MATVFKINNVAYTPKTISVSLQDVDYESGRNQKGKMVRDRRRGGANAVRKIETTFPPMSTTEMKNLLQAIKDASFSVYYPDPYTGAFRTATCYCGDRSIPMWTMIDGTWQWEGLNVNFVEF